MRNQRAISKNIRHLPNHGEYLFSNSTEVKIRYKVFKGQKRGFRSDTGVISSKYSGRSYRDSLQCITGKNI